MRQRRLMNEINVVPYIDVMLVLLVIFMVTAPLIQTGSIDLPSVGKSAQPPAAPLEVIIKADQTLELRDRAKGGDPRPVRKSDLPRLLQEAQTRKQSVLIAADKSVPYEAVIDIVDRASQYGLKVGLQVQQGK